MIMYRKKIISLIAVMCIIVSIFFGNNIFAETSGSVEKEYTLDGEFNEGNLNNVTTSVPDQLQLDDTTTPFGFIWIAVSSKGTIVKIDTKTGDILGEYKTAPDGQPLNPSRTTVDKNGSVWVGNRNGNSVTRVCLPESGLWIDKNGNGICDTSTGLGDVKSWNNAGGVDTNGGIDTATDECIINYVKVSSSGTRHVSVDKNNDVWVSGTGGSVFDLIDGVSGLIKRTEGSVGYGGYGGLIDGNGVIWSARSLLRWDTSNPLSGLNGVNYKGYGHDSYGLTIDKNGYVWNTQHAGDKIRKFAPDGTEVGLYSHGDYYAQGCVADSNGDIWIAHSLYRNTVGHIKNDGTFVGNITVGNGPTGVSVDSDGKIWVAHYNSKNAMRIDPTKGAIGADGVTPIGQVDYTSPDLGGNLYNYSDMTGSTLIGAPNIGTWNTVFDSSETGHEWGSIDWNSLENDDSKISVSVQTSDDGIIYSPQTNMENGDDINLPDARYLKIMVTFIRSSDGESPILYDLNVRSANTPPIVDEAKPSLEYLWPPNHKFVDVNIDDIIDLDNDEVSVEITKITSDEATTAKSSGGKIKSPDAYGIGTDTAELRSERAGKGNGRVYEISFIARDVNGGESEGKVKVCVPKSAKDLKDNISCESIDDGQVYIATEEN